MTHFESDKQYFHVCNIVLLCTFLDQGCESKQCYRIKVDFSLSDNDDICLPIYQPITWNLHTPEEEIRYTVFFVLACGMCSCSGKHFSVGSCGGGGFQPWASLLAVGLPKEEWTGEFESLS